MWLDDLELIQLLRSSELWAEPLNDSCNFEGMPHYDARILTVSFFWNIKKVWCEVNNWYLTSNSKQNQHQDTVIQWFVLYLFSGTVRVWHANTYRLESTLNYGLERVWTIACQRGSNNVALGYDEGSIMIKVRIYLTIDYLNNIIWSSCYKIVHFICYRVKKKSL